LSRKYPNRRRLKSGLRYLLTHRAGFSLWQFRACRSNFLVSVIFGAWLLFRNKLFSSFFEVFDWLKGKRI